MTSNLLILCSSHLMLRLIMSLYGPTPHNSFRWHRIYYWSVGEHSGHSPRHLDEAKVPCLSPGEKMSTSGVPLEAIGEYGVQISNIFIIYLLLHRQNNPHSWECGFPNP
ncbi:hypothetical protein O6P43_027175 [Quillaja saponaria]|uniref:Uncharacterized protein n=1 Tax=Quillaja saponaria TaxID=32244 RepID=A0AAD7L3U2_QUISA|nr:hypothetical protein O6P43_027175 [Quillaja saponaria]